MRKIQLGQDREALEKTKCGICEEDFFTADDYSKLYINGYVDHKGEEYSVSLKIEKIRRPFMVPTKICPECACDILNIFFADPCKDKSGV